MSKKAVSGWDQKLSQSDWKPDEGSTAGESLLLSMAQTLEQSTKRIGSSFENIYEFTRLEIKNLGTKSSNDIRIAIDGIIFSINRDTRELIQTNENGQIEIKELPPGETIRIDAWSGSTPNSYSQTDTVRAWDKDGLINVSGDRRVGALVYRISKDWPWYIITLLAAIGIFISIIGAWNDYVVTKNAKTEARIKSKRTDAEGPK